MNTDSNQSRDDLPIAVILEVDAVCRRYEAAWKAGQQPSQQDYLTDVSEAARTELCRELAAIEREYRRSLRKPPSVESIARRLAESSLISADQVQAFVASLSDERKPADGRDLTHRLLDAGRLTEFQAQAIYQGQGSGLVVGPYVVLDSLGRGGMGYVYKVQHRRMKRVVALKILPPSARRSQEAVQRFQREVETLAKLSHPNIVAAHDANEAHGTHYLVMEYVPGADLPTVLKRHGVLPVAQVVDWIRQAALGLEYAHQQGVVHRDIKPTNLLCGDDGTLKVLDLGLARLCDQIGVSDKDSGLTHSGQVLGTVDYMSPEQALDARQADARSDIYSLGCTLHYLLSGRAPYAGNSLAQKIIAHRDAPIPLLGASRPDVPAELEALLQRLLAKRPEDRPQTMSDVIATLEGLPSLPFNASGLPADLAPSLDTARDQVDQPTDLPNDSEVNLDLDVPLFWPAREERDRPSETAPDTARDQANEPTASENRRDAAPKSEATRAPTTREQPGDSSSSKPRRLFLISFASVIFSLGVLFAEFVLRSRRLKQLMRDGFNVFVKEEGENAVLTIITDGHDEQVEITGSDETTWPANTSDGYARIPLPPGNYDLVGRFGEPSVWRLLRSGQKVVIDLRNAKNPVLDTKYAIDPTDAVARFWLLDRVHHVKPTADAMESRSDGYGDQLGAPANSTGPIALDLSGLALTDQLLDDLASYNLLALDLTNTNLTDEGLRRLSRLRGLRILNLTFTDITDDGLAYVAQMKNLQALDLRGTSITGAGLSHFKNIASLESLSLAGTCLTDGGCQCLANLASLRFLDLHQTGITDGGIRHVVGLNSLTELILKSTNVTNEGIRWLMSLNKLRSLDVSFLTIDDGAIPYLSELKCLEMLDLDFTRVGRDGLKSFRLANQDVSCSTIGARVDELLDMRDGARDQLYIAMLTRFCPAPPAEERVTWAGGNRIKRLDATNCRVGNAIVNELAKLEVLEELDLTNARITKIGVTLLANAQNGNIALKRLILDDNPINDDSLDDLARLTSLNTLNLRNTDLSQDGITTLRTQMPKCKIQFDGSVKP